jgi:polyhydroxybutyrate depolymerase
MGRLAAALAALLGWAGAAAGCGTADSACTVESGTYRIVLPDQAEGPVPAVVFLHGFGSSGAGILKNTALVSAVTERGYALIAPDGTLRGGGSRRSWVFRPHWEGRDEAAFFAEVLQDAGRRFGVDADTAVLAGFSSGAFMVNYLACSDPGLFAGYAPVSGSFWRPQPEACAGPVRLFHTHGWSDGVVPLEGRPLGGGRFLQGDAFAGLELWRGTNACASDAPDESWQTGEFLMRRWDCGPGADIRLAVFPGGHRVPAGWTDMMLDWFEGAEAQQR